MWLVLQSETTSQNLRPAEDLIGSSKADPDTGVGLSVWSVLGGR